MTKKKNKNQKTIVIVSVLITVIMLIIGILFFSNNDKMNRNNNDYTKDLQIITNSGNLITTTYKEFDGFNLKIPDEFTIMKQELINLKYPSENRPSIVYTNDDGTINVNIKMTDTKLENNKVEETVKQTENLFKNIDENVEINFFTRNNYNLGEIKFLSGTIDKTSIYNHMLMFSINGKMTVISFNCLETQLDEWREVGEFIIKSIDFN